MKKILIDTHIFLWWLYDPTKIKPFHFKYIEDLHVECCISISSLFEISIKRSIGKLDANLDFKEIMNKSQFTLLQINLEHLEQYARLPLHHTDPFDRMIIAQSITENIPLISYDKKFSQYDYLKL